MKHNCKECIFCFKFEELLTYYNCLQNKYQKSRTNTLSIECENFMKKSGIQLYEIINENEILYFLKQNFEMYKDIDEAIYALKKLILQDAQLAYKNYKIPHREIRNNYDEICAKIEEIANKEFKE